MILPRLAQGETPSISLSLPDDRWPGRWMWNGPGRTPSGRRPIPSCSSTIRPDPYTRRGLLLNLGDPRTVDLAFEKISSFITEFNADIYRQDFNMSPLDA